MSEYFLSVIIRTYSEVSHIEFFRLFVILEGSFFYLSKPR